MVKTGGFPAGLAAPALRALAGIGAKGTRDLVRFTESDIAALHGIGPSALNLLKEEMARLGMSFKGGMAVDASPIDAYIDAFPEPKRGLLLKMRETIRKAAPAASEKISYRMPTFFLKGNLVHFAAFDRHIGFYPGANGVAAFEDRLGDYVHAKGSIQFPVDKPLPLKLVSDIVRFRVEENLAKKAGKK
jgi:uncharacterized protein YdhG (YjbR/CyaY superfamily)